MHGGNEIVDHPDLASGLHAANYVEIHCGVIVSSGSVTQGAGAVGQPVTDETGWTPIPPLNCNGVSATAGSEQTTPSIVVHAKAFFMILPLKPASRRD
jgi:hypothetical protein